MTTMTVADQVERVLKPIQQFVRGWMIGEPVDRLAAQLGLSSGNDLWIVGRAGVLGDGDADVAASGLAFLAPDRVRAAIAKAGHRRPRFPDGHGPHLRPVGQRIEPFVGQSRKSRPRT